MYVTYKELESLLSEMGRMSYSVLTGLVKIFRVTTGLVTNEIIVRILFLSEENSPGVP